MFCTYHKPRKCEHMRLCHLELILLIISFLGGMFAQTSSTFIKKLLLLILWVLVWVRNSWCGFSSNTYLYILFGTPFASSYSNHCCAWLVWLVEAIKNLHLCIVLNPIYIYPMPFIVKLILTIIVNTPPEIISNILIVFDNW